MIRRQLRVRRQSRLVVVYGVLEVAWPDTPSSGEAMQAFRDGLTAAGLEIESEEPSPTPRQETTS